MENQATNILPELDTYSGGIISLPNHTGTPERRLLLAILERAILDYVGNDAKEAREASIWIFGHSEMQDNLEEDADDEAKYDIFSFRGVCQQLDLNWQNIARIIKEMPKRGNRRVAPWYQQK